MHLVLIILSSIIQPEFSSLTFIFNQLLFVDGQFDADQAKFVFIKATRINLIRVKLVAHTYLEEEPSELLPQGSSLPSSMT